MGLIGRGLKAGIHLCKGLAYAAWAFILAVVMGPGEDAAQGKSSLRLWPGKKIYCRMYMKIELDMQCAFVIRYVLAVLS
jgi:hypothetical protein